MVINQHDNDFPQLLPRANCQIPIIQAAILIEEFVRNLMHLCVQCVDITMYAIKVQSKLFERAQCRAQARIWG